MNKRSAIVTAGGVVASFVAGVVSVSSGLGLGNTATAATTPTTGPSPARVKPIVKHRRIVVHRKAPTPRATQGGPQTVVLPAPATSTGARPSAARPASPSASAPSCVRRSGGASRSA